MDMKDSYDLIVIGAGIFGLAAAKTYIQLHPKHRTLIIEAESTCGGVWSKDRFYSGLKTNTLCGGYELPDFPLSKEAYGVKHGQHIPGDVLNRYLTDYAKKFGVFERTLFQTQVDTIESRPEGDWNIQVSPVSEQDGSSRQILHATKLIIAAGVASHPNIPSYPGQETFTPPFFHTKELCARKDTIESSKKVVVLGGGKSAYDCAYAFAMGANAQVDMVIRPTGKGPRWIVPAYVTPLKKMVEGLVNTRIITLFTPCPWGVEDGFVRTRNFLHGTTAGRFLVKTFWHLLGFTLFKEQGYNDPAVSRLRPLQPNFFWASSHEAIHNYPTQFFDLLKNGKIRVHIADINKLDGMNVHLTDGETLETDVVVCATGWKGEPNIKFVNFDINLEMSDEENERLINKADKDILDMFPILKDQPVVRSVSATKNKLPRNYRFVVPAGRVLDRNIAFAGMASTVSTGAIAAVQAIWISAFFDGKLERAPKSKEEVWEEAMLHTQFEKWRYPCGYGARFPDICFDGVPYVDLLLNDLGLKCHRKGTLMKDLMEAYTPSDYNGLIQEWMDRQKDQRSGGE